MSLQISRSLRDRIVAEAAAVPRLEVCGLLLGRAGLVTGAPACRNVAADPTRAFEIDPAALIAAHRAARAGGPDIIGCWHSHPSGNARPSAADAAAALDPSWWWLIVAGGEVGAFRVVPSGPIHGRFAPVALAATP
ncbi:Proteasome lid subunit RPN8/RPN11, contains Jab1/MPN metalloenzyme (JAMM) motif [Sphingomonas guangdongensis]|uniref:Proteasome lid subunit RPN8/RPN11, contains Jab1/MPN metalloenzyme (JAMM) motif n=2 Tax=Sphingomonas guangdongensis TaxID=1141890 RepID=A0A285R0J1_9SPHN|nr:M67 family metallopeptidase [Sphingomonas guangdongensis]SOB87630.1 Proteasome lid subunit RPN8/RPN11, contains Jab1/MPN metalloenzyme (JAMM) motif [Sphingomonas guangdongensis]